MYGGGGNATIMINNYVSHVLQRRLTYLYDVGKITDICPFCCHQLMDDVIAQGNLYPGELKNIKKNYSVTKQKMQGKGC